MAREYNKLKAGKTCFFCENAEMLLRKDTDGKLYQHIYSRGETTEVLEITKSKFNKIYDFFEDSGWEIVNWDEFSQY